MVVVPSNVLNVLSTHPALVFWWVNIGLHVKLEELSKYVILN